MSAARDVAAAHRLASLGLVRMGRARADAALSRGGGDVDGETLSRAAEIRRRESDWDGAAALLDEAAARFAVAGDRSGRACALALLVDCKIARGTLDEASALAESLGGGAVAVAGTAVVAAGVVAAFDETVAAQALLSCARGHAMEARQKMRALPDVVGGSGAVWLDLVRAEVLLEMGALTGAVQALDRAAAGLPRAMRFSEAALRQLWLRAWADVQSAWTQGARAAADLESARRSVARFERYAAAFPLYAAHAAQLGGEVELLSGADPSTSFQRAIHGAERARAPFLAARLHARQAVQRRAAVEATTQPSLDRARLALVDAGASARAGALVPKGLLERGTQRKSIALRLEQGTADAASSNEQGLEAVVEVSRYLASIRDLPTLLEKTLDAVVRVMRAERGALLEQSADGAIRCVAARGLQVDEVKEGSAAITFGVVRAAQQSGEAVLSDNALSDQRFKDRRSVVATDIRSVMCSPIRTLKRTFGYIYLDRRVLDVRFQAEQQDLLAAFCTQVAVAWENAVAFQEIEGMNAGLEAKVKERTRELRESLEQLTNTRLKLAEAQRDALEKEMSLARDIQRTILPAEDVVTGPGVRIFGTVVPASFCGGDFWAWAALDDRRSLVVVADVTGHGVAASLITAVARACLDTLSLTGEAKGPAAVLAAMNDVIHASAAGRLCATAFAVLVDAGAQTLTFASAGHNPPWHVAAADGAAVQLFARGQRLGEDRRATFDEATASFAAGDRLFLYTDGVVEWSNAAGKQYGDRRFRKAIEASFAQPIDEAVAAVRKDAAAFAAGSENDDDLTLVAVDLLVAAAHSAG